MRLWFLVIILISLAERTWEDWANPETHLRTTYSRELPRITNYYYLYVQCLIPVCDYPLVLKDLSLSVIMNNSDSGLVQLCYRETFYIFVDQYRRVGRRIYGIRLPLYKIVTNTARYVWRTYASNLNNYRCHPSFIFPCGYRRFLHEAPSGIFTKW